MPSPFPGMDPYLEGPLWPDLHYALASRIQAQLGPKLLPKYLVRQNTRIVSDTPALQEIAISYPDVSVFHRSTPASPSDESAATALTATPSKLKVPAVKVKIRLVNVEIRDAKNGTLITSIEILSPVNKRGGGLRSFRKKRAAMRKAGVHLLEIDLLRTGRRVVPGDIPKCDYLISLTEAHSDFTELWPLSIREPLPVIGIPLKKEDGSILLDIHGPLNDQYDAVGYNYSIDYTQPPPPPELSPEDAAWVRELTNR